MGVLRVGPPPDWRSPAPPTHAPAEEAPAEEAAAYVGFAHEKRLPGCSLEHPFLAPTFGDSTQWVLETVLGYDDERIAELAIAGALE